MACEAEQRGNGLLGSPAKSGRGQVLVSQRCGACYEVAAGRRGACMDRVQRHVNIFLIMSPHTMSIVHFKLSPPAYSSKQKCSCLFFRTFTT
jgi:hypothetical protein